MILASVDIQYIGVSLLFFTVSESAVLALMNKLRDEALAV